MNFRSTWLVQNKFRNVMHIGFCVLFDINVCMHCHKCAPVYCIRFF